MVWTERMRDSAFPGNLPTGWTGAVGGYYGGPRAYNVWQHGEWDRFKLNRKLPIWVGGLNGQQEGTAALAALAALGVPKGVWTALDLETRVDITYVEHFGAIVRGAGYRVMPYGSASTVTWNPPLDGYWIADYAGAGPFMYDAGTAVEVRATQYTPGQQFDSSTVKDWTYYDTPWWVK